MDMTWYCDKFGNYREKYAGRVQENFRVMFPILFGFVLYVSLSVDDASYQLQTTLNGFNNSAGTPAAELLANTRKY